MSSSRNLRGSVEAAVSVCVGPMSKASLGSVTQKKSVEGTHDVTGIFPQNLWLIYG